jgi:hypothetical protein
MDYNSIIAGLRRGDYSVLTDLPMDEQAAIVAIMKEMDSNGTSSLLSRMRSEDYEETPVDIETFIDSSLYLGKIGMDIYPIWRDELGKLFAKDSIISEVVVRGCVGSGKSTFAVIALLYKLYQIYCLHDPQRYFGLMEGSPIVVGFFNVFKYLARSTAFKLCMNWMKVSPFFRDILPRKNRGDEFKQEYMELPKNVTIALGSSAIHALSQNLLIGVCFTGSTKVWLTDGSNPTLEELSERDLDHDPAYVYSIDVANDKRVVHGKVKSARLTRHKSFVVNVLLSNFFVETCTPDHLWMLRDGSYKRAIDLVYGDELMQLGKRIKHNHNLLRVGSVEVSYKPEDVYCLTVEGYNNCALYSEAFVHNCDEADFSDKNSVVASDKKQIEDLYTQAKTRMLTRFMQSGGVNPGLLFLISQVRDTEAFLQDHVERIKDDPTATVISYSLWEAKEKLFRDEQRFKVAVGNKSIRSFIIDDKPLPQDLQIVDVPVSLRPRFEYDIDEAIRDLAGVPTYGYRLFFPRRDRIFDCYKHCTKREHPFNCNVVELSLEDDVQIADHFLKDKCLRRITYNKYQPIHYSSSPRVVHIDLAKNGDMAGMACGCLGEIRRTQRFDPDGRPYETKDHSTFIDFAIELKARHGSEIDFSKVRAFVFFLRDIGFPIKYITVDQYQSVDSQQTFKKEGFNVEQLSVDKTVDPYKCLKATVMGLLLDMYEFDTFTSELSKLQDYSDIKTHKPPIDHPKKGKKDLCDSVCGVVFKLAKEKINIVNTADFDVKILEVATVDDDIKTDAWLKKVDRPVNPLEELFK